MPDEFPVLVEVFDVSKVRGATKKWPKARRSPRLEPDHPPTLPDFHDGPFEPIDGWDNEFKDSVGWTNEELASLREDDEEIVLVEDQEIGYEGER